MKSRKRQIVNSGALSILLLSSCSREDQSKSGSDLQYSEPPVTFAAENPAATEPIEVVDHLAAYQELRNDSLEPDAVEPAFSRLAKADFVQAKSVFESERDLSLRNELVHEIVREWPSDPAGDSRLEWILAKTDGLVQHSAIGVLMDDIAEHDVNAALVLWEKTPYGRARDSGLAQIARRSAIEDPAATFDWLRVATDPSSVHGAHVEAARVFVQVHYEDAVRYLGDFQDLDGLGRTLLAAWIDYSPQSALPETARTVLETVPQETRGPFASRVVTRWAQHDPIEAAKFAARYSDLSRPSIVESLANSLAELNVQQAISWMESLPEKSAQNHATAVIVAKWMHTNSLAASEWINQLPAGDRKDYAVVALIRELGKSDLGAAKAWAETIGDPDLKASVKEFIN